MTTNFYLFAKRLAIVLGMCLCLHGMADGEPKYLVNGVDYGPNVCWTVRLKAGTAGSLFDDTLGPVRTFRYETVVTVDGEEKLVIPGGTWSSNQGDSTYTAKIPLRDLGLLTPEACGTHYLVAFTRNYEGNSTVDTGYSMLYVDSYCTISMQNYIHLEATDGDYYDRVHITWNQDDAGATYTLSREGVTLATALNDTSYDDTTAVPGVKYKYQVISSTGTESNQDEGYAMPLPPKLGELTLIGVPVPANHVAVGERKDFLVAERKFDAEVKVIDLNSDFYSLQSSKLIGSPCGEVAKYEHLHTNGGLACDLESDDIIAFKQNTLKFGRGFHGEYSWRVEAVFVDVKGRSTERVSEIVDDPVFFRKYGEDHKGGDNKPIPNWFTYWKEDGACPSLKNAECAIKVDFGLQGKAYGEYRPIGEVALNPTDTAKQHYPDGPISVVSPQEHYFSGPHIWGIYTVEEVVAHELSHAKLNDSYTKYNQDDYLRKIGWLWGKDSDFHRPKEFWRADDVVDIDGENKWCTLRNVEREYCDHLFDSQETGEYKEYALDKENTDTYGIGRIKGAMSVSSLQSDYTAYGDDEFLAMIAANKATDEKRAVRGNDWAFPGEQSCVPTNVVAAREFVGWPQIQRSRLAQLKEWMQSLGEKKSQKRLTVSKAISGPFPITVNGLSKAIEHDVSTAFVSAVCYKFDMTVGGLQELRLSGVMTDLNSNVVAYANAAVLNGNVSAELRFLGNEIYESGKEGPFRLDMVKLVAFDGNDFSELATLYEFKDGEVDLRRSDFARNDAYLLDVTKEIVTTNGIEVSVNAEINTAGDYEIFATLADTNGIKVASCSMTANFVQGTNCINVVFGAGEILQSGIDGPYVIDNVVLMKDGVRADSRLDYYALRKKYRVAAFDFDGSEDLNSEEFMSQFEDYTPPVELPPPERFWVFFNPNGGSASETIREIVSGEMVGTLPVPTLGNDEFLGWFTELDGGTIISDSTVITTNVMYHAHWKEVPDQIQFAVSELTVDENDTVTISVVGGNVDAACRVEVYLAYNTTTAADLDLANGTIDGVTPEGGLKFPLTLSWAAGEVGEKVIAIPIKKDAIIENDESFTLGLENPSGIEMGDVSECVVTIADATIAYTVTFDANEGVVTEASRKVAESAEIGTLPKPTRDGYSFLGWFTEADGGTQISVSTVVVGDVTFYAHWTDKVTVKFASSELTVDENGTATVCVLGGGAEKASSVDVYLTWNTAVAADVDLGKTKFPLTLKWAKGEIGEKIITIPIKTDKAVEGDEFFTLQLANAQGVELGEERVCTVTIKDANTSLTLQNGMLSPTVSATTKGDGNWFVAPGSPLDEEGLPPLYHVESPSLPQGKSSALSFTVKGQGVLHFSIRFTGDPNEETPSVMDIYSAGRYIGTISHATVTNVWKGYTITATGGTLNASRNYSFVFVQGSGSDTHVEISNVYWDYLGNIAPSTFYSGRVYSNDPSGGVVSGSGYYSYDQTLKLVAKAFPGWTFDGWYLIEDDDETGERSYHFLTKATTASYKVDTDFSIMAFFSKIPYIRALADPADGGKVSGGGLCEKGKKVTLKATANKGFVFTGWVAASTGETPVVPVATTPTLVIDRSTKPTKNSATSTTITDVAGDTTYYACFVTAEEDKKSIQLTVNGEEMRLTGDGSPHQTNIWTGVYLEWLVAAGALSDTTVKVSGLPSGLKFAAKPVTSKVGTGKAAVVVTNVPANTIYGVTTAASKADKRGAVKPSAVKVTVTTAGKSSQTYQIDMTVDPLPAWAQGTFAGGVWGSTASPSGLASLTVAANGKVSGKVQAGEFAYTLSAPYYSGVAVFADGVNLVTNFFADVTASLSYKEGKKTVKTSDVVRMTVRDNGVGGVVTGGPLSSAADDGTEWAVWQYNWAVEPWETIGKSFDKKTLTYAILADGSFSESEEALTAPLGAEVTGRVTLKFTAKGAVTVAGEFALYDAKKAKYTTVKASGSATLVPIDGDHGAVFIYLTPKRLPQHARSLTVP